MEGIINAEIECIGMRRNLKEDGLKILTTNIIINHYIRFFTVMSHELKTLRS